MQRITLLVYVVLVNLLVAAFAHAKDDIIGRSYYLDASNAMSFQQVQREIFTPYQDVLTGGFQKGTYWLKLRIRHSDNELVLRIRPIFTEEIELFDPESIEKKSVIGAKYSWRNNEIEGVTHNFLIEPSSTDRDVYLRVKSARSYTIYVDAMSKSQYHSENYTQQLIYTGYSAFTFLLALWLFITWLTSRELVLGIFTIQQFLAFVHTTFQTGFIRPFLESYVGATHANELFSLTVVIYPFVSLCANKLLLQEYGLKRAFKALFGVLMLLSVGVICLYLSGNPLAFKMNNLLVLSAVLSYCLSSIFGTNMSQAGFKAGALPINTLRFFYTINLAFWIVTILPFLGLMPAGEMALHTIYFYNLLSGLVFFFILQFRSKSLLKLETEKATALKAEADQERKQREEQSMLMTMLSHEIRTPLSILKLVVDEKVAGSDLEGHANRAVSNIDFIVQRCLQLGKLDAEAIRLDRSDVNLDDFFKGLVEDCQMVDRVVIDCFSKLIIKTDKDLLRVVFSNLLENAIKYSPEDSLILLKAKPHRSNQMAGVQIEVTNQSGMLGTPDPEQVFKKFYRNPSATKISGSGLGLYLVHELVGLLGGKVQYESEESRVVFKVWIPN